MQKNMDIHENTVKGMSAMLNANKLFCESRFAGTQEGDDRLVKGGR